MTSQDLHDSAPDAPAIFSRFLELVETGTPSDFESFVIDYPELTEELRVLHEKWQRVNPLLEGLAGPSPSRLASSPSSSGPSPGMAVGDYRLLSKIGEGGMGEVWEARQASLGGRKVALKFVRPDRISMQGSKYFAREARAGGRLNHPGIVTVHASGESDGLAWIAMELVPGSRSLRDYIADATRGVSVPEGYDRQVAVLVASVARAMHSAHTAGVIHRDLKPRNILLDPGGEPKLTDFGLARITDEPAISHTGEVPGTFLYMSPEQLGLARSPVDHRTDIFSLGVVLYEMLTLRRPFQGDTSQQVAAQIVTTDPPDPRTIRSRVPRDLVVISGKALEKDRDQRFATMAELADDLERFLCDEPILAKPPTPVQRMTKWVKRNPARSLAVAVAAVAFMIITSLLIRIAGQNTALEAKTDEAQANAAVASENAAAEKQRADEVLRLSLSQDFEDLMAEAGELWPAYPDKIDGLRGWLLEANGLIERLPLLVSKRDELRAMAVPRTEEERQAERESHPEFETLALLPAEIEARQNALAVRRGAVELELRRVNWSDYPEDARGLNRLAWPRVSPDREAFGQEALGLVLAIQAVKLASEGDQAAILDSVAWGRLAVGDDEAALAASRAALDAAREEKREEYAGYLARLEAAVSAASSAEGFLAAETAIAELESSLAEIEARVDEQRTWQFPDTEEGRQARWWHNQLTGLISELESLTAPGTGLLTEDGVSEELGWSMARRLVSAEHLRAGFLEGGEFAVRWEEDLPAIREAYPGLELTVQMGLVPIGSDPESRLWEFWHVQSGTEPVRDEDDRLLLEEGSGLVFVLLPGGEYWMGAQSSDPNGRNYDKDAHGAEGPAHEVKLSPFFLSKYEMTQGQWMRLAGHNPSYYGPSYSLLDYRHDLTHPVEMVSWLDCMALLPNLGLVLPREAQWEYGARGGTDTVWWTGSDRESLRTREAVNLADQAAARAGAGWDTVEDWPELDDGFVLHAPVDEYAANRFGLHNVHGNVWEWCQDRFDRYSYRRSPELNSPSAPVGPDTRVSRGGSFRCPALGARCALRNSNTPALAGYGLGVRPARLIEP